MLPAVPQIHHVPGLPKRKGCGVQKNVNHKITLTTSQVSDAEMCCRSSDVFYAELEQQGFGI